MLGEEAKRKEERLKQEHENQMRLVKQEHERDLQDKEEVLLGQLLNEKKNMA